jgi:hypothetical protein
MKKLFAVVALGTMLSAPPFAQHDPNDPNDSSAGPARGRNSAVMPRSLVTPAHPQLSDDRRWVGRRGPLV